MAKDGAPARNARPADPESDLAWSAARVRGAPAPAANLQGRAPDSAGLALPCAVPPRASGPGHIRVGESDNKRQAKYYSLTSAGRKRLREETDYWQRLSGAIGLVLDAAPGDV